MFLLQLGSYGDEQEARERWETVSSEHPDILRGLSLRISGVSLPPDNYTIYRTQVGPLEYKAEAASLCKQLKAQGVECFVVETAMYSDALPAKASRMDPEVVEVKEPPSTSLEEDEYAPVIVPESPAPEAAQKELAAGAAEEPQAPQPARLNEPLAEAELLETAEQGPKESPPEATSKTPESIETAEKEREISAAATGGEISSEPVSSPEAASPPPAAPPREKAALPWIVADSPTPPPPASQEPAAELAEKAAPAEKAVEKTQESELSALSLPPPGPPPGPSPVPPPAAREEEEKEIAAPKEQSSEAQSSLLPWLLESAPESPVQPPPPPVAPAPAVETPPHSPSPVAAAPAPLPVPKPIMRDLPAAKPAAKAAVAARLPWTVEKPPVHPKPARPAATATAKHLPQKLPWIAARPSLPPKHKEKLGREAKVSVAEAIRVPLSQDADGMKVREEPSASATPPPEFRPRALGRGASPSQNFNQRTLWAQLRYFSSEREAMNRWNAMRYDFPGYFDGVRGQVTRPYQDFKRSGNVSLRIGPFLTMAEIREVCALPGSEGLECTVVKDIGSSVIANAPRYRPYDNFSGTQRSSAPENSRAYWVQLGSYASPAQANREWDRMQTAHPDLLRRLQPDVYSPALSSAPRSIFRLRTGPYVNHGLAKELCDKLQWRGINCLVLLAQ